MFTTDLTRAYSPCPTVTFKTRYDLQDRRTVITALAHIDWQPLWEADDHDERLQPWSVLDTALSEAGIADRYDYDDDGNDDKLMALREAFDAHLAASDWGKQWDARQVTLEAAVAKFAEKYKGVSTDRINEYLRFMDSTYANTIEMMSIDLEVRASEFVEGLTD